MSPSELHQHLIEAGEFIPAAELKSGVAGPGTEAAIRNFQSKNRNAKGKPLAIDGLVGPNTVWALTHVGEDSQMYTVGSFRYEANAVRDDLRPVTEAAFGQIGVKEDATTPNRSKTVDVFGGNGNPWCAYFVSWCYSHYGLGSPFGVLASAYKMREWGKAKGKLVSGEVRAGDVFVILRGDLHGHVGLVVGVLPDKRICTIEGNSKNAVRGLVRRREEFIDLVRPVGER